MDKKRRPVLGQVAMKELLEPLGIPDIPLLRKCVIDFEINDVVVVTTEHFLPEPTEEAKTVIRKYCLSEIIEKENND